MTAPRSPCTWPPVCAASTTGSAGRWRAWSSPCPWCWSSASDRSSSPETGTAARSARAVARCPLQRAGPGLGGLGALHRARAAARGQPVQEAAGKRGPDPGRAVRRHGRPDGPRGARSGARGRTVHHRQRRPGLDHAGPRTRSWDSRCSPPASGWAEHGWTRGGRSCWPSWPSTADGVRWTGKPAQALGGNQVGTVKAGTMEVVILPGSKQIASLAADAVEALAPPQARRRPGPGDRFLAAAGLRRAGPAARARRPGLQPGARLRPGRVRGPARRPPGVLPRGDRARIHRSG